MEKTKEEILKRCFENMYKGLKFDDMEGFKNSKQYSSLSDCFDLINDYKLIEIEGVSGKLLSAERELYLLEKQNEALTKRVNELEKDVEYWRSNYDRKQKEHEIIRQDNIDLQSDKRELIEGIENIQQGLVFIDTEFNNGLGFDSDSFDDNIKEISDLLLKHR